MNSLSNNDRDRELYMANIKCILMNKNTPVLQLEGELITVGNTCFPFFKAEQCEIINKVLSPPAVFSGIVSKRLEQFNMWFQKRCISANRVIPIDPKRVETDTRKPMFFSMTDQYWLQYDKHDKWEDYNYFTNPFSYVTGDALFSKSLDWVKTIPFDANSPDVTTNGVMNKRWIKDNNNKNILLKTNSSNLFQESKSEILASAFLKDFARIPYVTYYPYIYNYSLCCACRNFITEDTEFVTAGNLFHTVKMPDAIRKSEDKIYQHLLTVIAYYKIPDAIKFIEEMTVIDRIMVNQDRHLGNFGFIRNVNTGAYIGPAPLFDFGNAYFPGTKVEKSKYFFSLEKDLALGQRIKPQNISQFVEMLNQAGIDDEKEKEGYIKIMEDNNKFILSIMNGEEIKKDSRQTPVINF